MHINSVEVQNFVDHVKKECENHGVDLRLRHVKYLKLTPSIRCGGYFDDVDKVLACSTNREDWLMLLVHEYAHMTQWLDGDNCAIWKKLEKLDSLGKVDEWLAGKEVRNYKHHLSICRDLELDNEKRAVQIIKDFGLDIVIDVKEYTKRANCYVLFYNYMKYTRSWYKSMNPPYNNAELMSHMSVGFDMNYEKLDKHIKEAFDKCKI